MSVLHLTLIIPADLTHLVLELVEAPAESVLQNEAPAVEPAVIPEATPEPTPESEPIQKKRFIGG